MKVLIVGRSGTGKDYLATLLRINRLKDVKSYTTRPKRSEDENTHIFITPEQAKQYTDRVAETVINGYEYFATREQVETCDFYIIDPNGVKELLANMPDTAFLVVHVQAADQDEVKKRAIARETNKEHAEAIYESRRASEDAQFSAFESLPLNDPKHPYLGDTVPLSTMEFTNDFCPETLKECARAILAEIRLTQGLVPVVEWCAEHDIISQTPSGKLLIFYKDPPRKKEISPEQFAMAVAGDRVGLGTLMHAFLSSIDDASLVELVMSGKPRVLRRRNSNDKK